MSSLDLPFRRFLLTVAVAVALAPPAMAAGRTTLVSIDSSGTQGSDHSEIPAISADGRFVAFRSSVTTLVPDDTNAETDIFVHDRYRGETTRVSVSSSGTQANGFNIIFVGGISGDGRLVAFTSDATNLVAGDTNATADAFIHDRLTGTTTRISVASNRRQGNSDSRLPVVSADGRIVAFWSNASKLVRGDTNDMADAFVHDRATHKTVRVSLASSGRQGNGSSLTPVVSGNGRFVAFVSDANNLVRGDTNGATDVFVHDRATHKTIRISVNSDGTQGNGVSSGIPAISADGRFVAFRSDADNLVPGDTNGAADIFIHDRTTHETFLVSVSSSGVHATGASELPTLSADGRFVAFRSIADNLVTGDTNGHHDIFVHDRETQRTTRASVASSGTQADNSSFFSAVSADGRFVAFESQAYNLVPRDNNPIGYWDIFVRDRLLLPGQTADLVVSQTESADPVTQGDLLTYTVTVKNKGPDLAHNVSLIDLVPHNMRLLSVSPSQGSCSKAPVSVCRLGRLAAGDSATVEVRLRANRTGVLRNTVFGNAPPKDHRAGNNTRTISTTVE